MCILDGKSGKPVYEKPFIGVPKDQVGGLSLRMSGYGNDMFVFWSSETICSSFNNDSIITNSTNKTCSQSLNTTYILKLNAMNQYDQPPGFELYSSGKYELQIYYLFYLFIFVVFTEDRKLFDPNDTKSSLEEAIEFLRNHPERVNTEFQERHNAESYERPVQIKHTYQSELPNFRKTYNRKNLAMEYAANRPNKFTSTQVCNCVFYKKIKAITQLLCKN